MFDNFLNTSTIWLQSFPAEVPSLLTLILCLFAILVACRYGFAGLCTYNAIAVIVGNIQVLRLGIYYSSPEPVALGTIIFSTTFLVSAIIAEYYGAKRAGQALLACFLSQLFVTILMFLCLGHAGVVSQEQNKVFVSLQQIFVPQGRFFVASLIAYVVGQSITIGLYQTLKKVTGSRFLWLRQNVATCVAGLVDGFMFSYLAWIVLNPQPLSLHTVLVSYVLSGYVLRVVVTLLGTPVIYCSKRILPLK